MYPTRLLVIPHLLLNLWKAVQNDQLLGNRISSWEEINIYKSC